jgi:hypothetical protein
MLCVVNQESSSSLENAFNEAQLIGYVNTSVITFKAVFFTQTLCATYVCLLNTNKCNTIFSQVKAL